jgi:hypothetical protein
MKGTPMIKLANKNFTVRALALLLLAQMPLAQQVAAQGQILTMRSVFVLVVGNVARVSVVLSNNTSNKINGLRVSSIGLASLPIVQPTSVPQTIGTLAPFGSRTIMASFDIRSLTGPKAALLTIRGTFQSGRTAQTFIATRSVIVSVPTQTLRSFEAASNQPGSENASDSNFNSDSDSGMAAGMQAEGITLGAPLARLTGKVLRVSSSLTNNVSTDITNVRINWITLASLPVLQPSSAPSIIRKMAAGSSTSINASFDISSVTKPTAALMTVRGTYVNGERRSFMATRLVVIPAAVFKNSASLDGTMSTATAGESQVAADEVGGSESAFTPSPDTSVSGSSDVILSGASEIMFNSLDSQVVFHLYRPGSSIDPAEVVIQHDNEVLPESSISVFDNTVRVNTGLKAGANDLILTAKDTQGAEVFKAVRLWAGNLMLSVNVVDESGNPVDGALVTARLAADSRVSVSITANGGTTVFNNLPDRAMVIEAIASDGRFATIEISPAGGSVQLKLSNPADGSVR